MIETINNIAFWGLITLLILEAYNILFHGAIPNLRTAPAVRKKMVEFLKRDMAAKKKQSGEPYVVVDLGSGNGRLTREIAAALPEAQVIGIELAKTSVWWSNFMKKRVGLKNLEYKKMDFLTYDFSEPDAFVMYLLPHVLWKVSDKLSAEAQNGACIICNHFPLSKPWVPEETLQIKTLYVNQKDLYLYRKG